MEHDTEEACIRACVKNILAKRLLVGGLTCHFAPAAQPSRVPYGHGKIIGNSFEYRSGHWAQVCLVAPALEFVKPSMIGISDRIGASWPSEPTRDA